MARLVTSGGELQVFDGASGVEGQNITFGTGSIVFDTVTFRSGLASIGISFPDTTASNAYRTWSFTGATNRGYYARTYVRLKSIPGTQMTGPLTFLTAGAVAIARTIITTAGKLQLVNATNSTQVGSDSAALTVGQLYRVELRCRVPSSGNGTLELLLNGVVVASSATQSIGTAALGQVREGIVSNNSGAWTDGCNLDDFALNDDTGANQNSYPGAGKVVLLTPTSDNARVGFTAGGGGTTNLFDAVNNKPPVGVADASATNASQIHDANANTTDTYDANLGAYSTAVGSGGGGLDDADVVQLVQSVIRFGPKTAAACQLGQQLLSNPTVAETVGAATAAAAVAAEPTGWVTQAGTVTYSPAPTLATQPVMRVRKATSAVSIGCDLMGLLVEYTFAGTFASTQAQGASVTRQVLRAVAGAQAQGSAFVRALGRTLAGPQPQAAALTTTPGRALPAAQAAAASLVRQPARTLSATEASSGLLSSRASARTVPALQPQSAALARALSRAVGSQQPQTASQTRSQTFRCSAAQGASAVVVRRAGRQLSAGQGQATPDATRALSRTVGVSQSQSASSGRQMAIAHSAVQQQAGALARVLARTFSAGQGQQAAAATALSRTVSTGQGLSATATVIPTRQVAITATVTVGAAVARSLQRTSSVTQPQAAIASRALARALGASQSQQASATASLGMIVAAAQGTAAGLSRQALAIFVVTQSQLPALARAFTRTIAVAQAEQASVTVALTPAQPLRATQASAVLTGLQARRLIGASQTQAATVTFTSAAGVHTWPTGRAGAGMGARAGAGQGPRGGTGSASRTGAGQGPRTGAGIVARTGAPTV